MKVQVLKIRLAITTALSKHLHDIDVAGVYSNFGPKYQELRRGLAEYFGCRPEQIALLSNATQALTAVVAASTASDQVIAVPSWTFAATGHSVLQASRRLLVTDADGGLSPKDGRVRFSASKKFPSIAVAPFGYFSKELEVASAAKTFVAVDAASCFSALNAIGNRLDVETSSPIVVSAHATKGFSMGEGGIVIGSEALVREIETWSNFGFQGERSSIMIATNSKVSEYACAVGLASLDYWPELEHELFQTHNRYANLLPDLIELPSSFLEGAATTTYVVRVEREFKTALLESFGSDVDYRNWWSNGLHQMTAFTTSADDSEFPVTEHEVERTLGLPFGNNLSSAELEFVAERVRRCSDEYEGK